MTTSAGVLALVVARGGSKGVPRKNVRPVGGLPLIAWTIRAAKGAARVDRVVLSSDDAEIIAVAREHGCDVPFVREARLAADDTPTMDVVDDALSRCPGYEWLVLLQATSPLRTSADIDAAISLCAERRAPACVSVTLAEESPYWMFRLESDDRLSALMPGALATRRQDLPEAYSLNGAIYVARVEWLRGTRSFISDETVAFVMPRERSVDLDHESDFLYLQTLMENQNGPLFPSS